MFHYSTSFMQNVEKLVGGSEPSNQTNVFSLNLNHTKQTFHFCYLAMLGKRMSSFSSIN